jgi:acyl-CoA reductase-like NAD-dependent aldehyde dehydrogenase
VTDLVAARRPYIGGRWAAGEGGEFVAAITPYKQSGYGRERGAAGIRAFQELKHVVVGGR